ncbi:ATP synthase subunit I [Paenibacillus rhizophilus]|uniref:ATP synthase subunit I n=1 Tax=Paenibacillus rhizophilus TaxID=1850366 RepID=A0A3N9P3M8_9BACL|nr:ATP synthase subunit I [Paenibacillus rhizophilus]RQW10349.1 ATP synthase subunit I [Paenibacillus rhizophilus]
MSDTFKLNRLLLATMMGMIAVCLVIAELLPHHRTVFYGVMLGSAVSCLNVLHTGYRVSRVTRNLTEGRKGAGFGFGVRIATSILAIMLALKFPHLFNEIAVCASLVIGQFLVLIISAVLMLKK